MRLPPPRKPYLTSIYNGFTLSEGLITLGIIGIVAALTLPSVISNIQDKQFKAKFKKTYSTIAQAMQLAYLDYGEEINTSSWQEMPRYVCEIAKHLNVVSSGLKCDVIYSGSNIIDESGQYSKDIFNEKVQFLPDGEWFTKQKQYMMINPSYKNLTLYLADGTWVNFNCFRQIFIDVNGIQKPNTIGRDIFYFTLPKNKVSPSFFENNDNNTNVNGCSNPFTTEITKDNYEEDCLHGTGWGCSPMYILE